MILNKDVLISALSDNGNIQAYYTSLINSASEICRLHAMNNISSALFCRALSGAVLLSGSLKNAKDVINLNWNCTGPAQSIVVDVCYNGEVRGFIGNPHLTFIEGSESDKGINSEPYIGFGEITVTRKSFSNASPYISVTPVETGEIAQDISLFLDQSLQIESAVKVGLDIDVNNNINKCSGILFMAMPGADKDEVKKIYNIFNDIGELSSYAIDSYDNIKNMLKRVGLSVVGKKNIFHKCRCNVNTIAEFIKNCSVEKRSSFYNDDGKIEIECRYCKNSYIY